MLFIRKQLYLALPHGSKVVWRPDFGRGMIFV